MTTERKTAIIIGSLFLISTTTFLIGDELIGSIVYTPEYLKNSYPNVNLIGLGVILQLINDIAVVSIGVIFLPILKNHHQNIAFAYMGSRIIEGALLLVSAVSLLSIVLLSEQYLNIITTEVSYFETLGVLFKAGRYTAFQLAMIALSTGSLLLCYLLYRTKLIPRILSILGFIGYTLLLLKMLTEIAGYSFGGEMLYLPGALFEILMPLWLIIKGFNVSSNISYAKKV
ncbi:DUF4386 domain-containing protein [Aquimarina pacifica]|uniref:DUF4386 domain-containing protein n=1 Tax=Aquimarina pacifica TaxID=1296415 RepID=UPI00046E955C|nr:DUF4386 domain-containing protein [Aquimarina pacifica]